jgi:hypothetical protein
MSRELRIAVGERRDAGRVERYIDRDLLVRLFDMSGTLGFVESQGAWRNAEDVQGFARQGESSRLTHGNLPRTT